LNTPDSLYNQRLIQQNSNEENNLNKNNSTHIVKKCTVLQVNDAAVSLRLVIFVSKVQFFYTQITEQTKGGRGERRGVPLL
jgi:hypothetical protein